jgi:glucuronate isomerase
MVSSFMDDNFLLSNATAVSLFHRYAKTMPIIDYHCHLSPKEIYENKTYQNIAEVWLYGDHYKWRAMRANGIEEQYITGDAGDYDKFLAYARTVPMLIGNPLYHWSHLELRRYFGVYDLINERNAPIIWEKVNALLASPGFGARDFITKSDVIVICTTDDPSDSLEYHSKLREEKGFPVKVLPAFRPDKGLEINGQGFKEWIHKLEGACGEPLVTYAGFLRALEARVDFFHSVGGRVSDHALDYVPYAESTLEEAAQIFERRLDGETVSFADEQKYKTYTLRFLGKLYADRGWVMQYHINAARNNNTRMFGELGPDTGFDSMNDSAIAYPLSRLLDALDKEDALPKTVLYSLNRSQNHLLATIIGNFQGGGIPGKMQFGSAWWFNDTKEGMIEQMKSLADSGLLGRFVGMLTDSRSFLSYTRHEYFRRILCQLIGEWVENGEFPDDEELLGQIVQNICCDNAKGYFGMG